VPVRELDQSIPPGLSDIVSKCLERDVNLRYQSAWQILGRSGRVAGKRPVSASMIRSRRRRQRPGHSGVAAWKWAAAGGGGGAAVGGWVYRGKLQPSAQGRPATAAGQKSHSQFCLSRTALGCEPGLAGHKSRRNAQHRCGSIGDMRTVSPDRIHQIFADLRLPQNTDWIRTRFAHR